MIARPIELSIVIPLFNEEGSLRELHRRLTASLAQVGQPYEVLFVNDGSTDASAAMLDELAGEDPHVGVIHFRRNFGKAAGLDAGFRQARGRVIITMDADLQDEPNEIPRLLEQLDRGYDVVSGWKKVRHDPLSKTLPSKLFNATVSRLSGLRLHDFNCGFKAYRAEAVDELHLYGEMHRFVPVLVHWRGFRVTEIPVEHHPRTSGTSKYGMKRLVKGFFDLMTVMLNTRYQTRPMHLFGLGGLACGFAGFAVLLYLTILWFLGHPIGGRPLFFLGILLLLLGVQLVSAGLLGELIVRGQQEQHSSYTIRATQPPRIGAGADNRWPDEPAEPAASPAVGAASNDGPQRPE